VRIAVDLDNTLVDELAKGTRPGIHAFLGRLRARGHTLILFTQSTKARARTILRDHGLEAHFAEFFYREDWDRENRNPPKDLRLVQADALIDDDPQNVAFARELGKRGFLVRAYRGGRADEAELAAIERALRR
jgi:beta-phosphoglucomutase-like phosphatase (HAD superfamily)